MFIKLERECDYMKPKNNKSILIFLFRLSYLLTLIYSLNEAFSHSSSKVFPILLVGSGAVLFSIIYSKEVSSIYVVFNKLADNLILATLTILLSIIFIWF